MPIFYFLHSLQLTYSTIVDVQYVEVQYVARSPESLSNTHWDRISIFLDSFFIIKTFSEDHSSHGTSSYMGIEDINHLEDGKLNTHIHKTNI